MREIRTTHGQTGTYAYRAWAQIVQRCTNPDNPAFRYYGGRGITMHPAWRESFEEFAKAIGERPSNKHTLDRSKNNNGYVPGNVQWATRQQQARNRRSNKFLTIGDETKTFAEWVETSGIVRTTAQRRLAKGWSARDAFFGK